MSIAFMRMREFKWYKIYFYATLLFIICISILTRFYFVLEIGGFSGDQLAWADANYYGGLTRTYIYMRDIIMSGETESKLFSYLPGYPGLLILFKLVAIEKPIYIRFTQSIIDTLAILPLFYIVNSISRSHILAFVACGIYAISPWWAAGSTYLLAESLLPALFITLIAALVAIREHPDKMHYWIALGFFAAILPFFRSEMVLLFIPLAVWAMLVTPARQRLASSVCVLLAFGTPLLAWIIQNYTVHGLFLLTPPVKWYAAWAGLGQVPNDYGYFVNDQLAEELLISKGVAWHSVQAEAYWKTEYLSAWLQHPTHVLETIYFRFKLILTTVDLTIIGLTDFLFWVMLCTAPIALFWLLWKRRWSDAFLVALPAGYAVCSLGILYVEQRYVRYASLSYVLAFPIFLAAVANLPSYFVNNWGDKWAKISKAVLGTIALGALVAYSINLLPILRLMAVEAAFTIRRDLNSMEKLPWTGTLKDLSFQKSIPEVEFSNANDGLTLKAPFNVNSGSYFLVSPMSTERSKLVLIRYKVMLEKGGLGIGFLSEDKTYWMSYKRLLGAPGSVLEGSILEQVDAGSSLVIAAEQGEGGYRAVFQDLRWKAACPQIGQSEPLLLFFNKDLISMEPCVQNQIENQVE